MPEPRMAETHAPASRWAIRSPVGMLAILSLINLLNYVDRQVLAPLVVLLEQPPAAGGLGLSSFQGGLLATAFMVVHSVASVPLGLAADRWARQRLIALGVAVWSVATAGAALARTFGQLFVARAAVGIGEATYAPAASALISERFSPGARARALGVFQLGMVLGGAGGMVLGSVVGSRYGWRAAFLVVGLPGLVLALIALLIHSEREVHKAEAGEPHRSIDPIGALRRLWRRPGPLSVKLAPVVEGGRRILRQPALVWVNVAGILITFFSGALIFWGPKFIIEYQYGGDVAFLHKAGLTFGIIATGAGLAGTLAGSFLADLVERRRPGAGRLLVIAAGTFLSIPCALVGFFTDSYLVLLASLSLGVFFILWYVGPILAALHDVVPASWRGTATGTYLLLVHLLGDAFSPAVVGFVTDATGSLRAGFVVATVVLAGGGLAALAAIPGSRIVAKLKLARPAGTLGANEPGGRRAEAGPA